MTQFDLNQNHIEDHLPGLMLFSSYYDIDSTLLHDVTIAVADAFDGITFDPDKFKRCAHHRGPIGNAQRKKMFCTPGPMKARFVVVYMDTLETLSLCEVLVYGQPASGPATGTIKSQPGRCDVC